MSTSADTKLTVRRLTVRTGAEVSGADLRRLRDGDVVTIREALLDHRVVFFRDLGSRHSSSEVLLTVWSDTTAPSRSTSSEFSSPT
jgi:alpha-ketoglutarate-dependent taurine dioxygenase